MFWVPRRVFQDTQYSLPRYQSNSPSVMGREISLQGTHEWYLTSEMRQIWPCNRAQQTWWMVCVSHLLTCLHFPDSTSSPWSRKQRWDEVGSPVCPGANAWYVLIFCPDLWPYLSLPLSKDFFEFYVFFFFNFQKWSSKLTY